jgi:hypothetical protein
MTLFSRIQNMDKPVKPKSDQLERFIETARQLGGDEDEKAFDEKLKKIAKSKPDKPRQQGK